VWWGGGGLWGRMARDGGEVGERGVELGDRDISPPLKSTFPTQKSARRGTHAHTHAHSTCTHTHTTHTLHTHTRAHIHTRTHTQIHLNTRTHAHIHTHTHTHTHILSVERGPHFDQEPQTLSEVGHGQQRTDDRVGGSHPTRHDRRSPSSPFHQHLQHQHCHQRQQPPANLQRVADVCWRVADICWRASLLRA